MSYRLNLAWAATYGGVYRGLGEIFLGMYHNFSRGLMGVALKVLWGHD